MANSVAMLNKLSRNLDMLGISNTRGASSVVASGLTISYIAAAVAGPMGGVSDAAAPFLGMGIVAPGTIKIKGAGGETSVAGILDSETNAKILALCVAFGNSVILESGDAATTLATIPGHVDFLGMGS